MPLPLFLRKLTASVEVKQVLAALDQEKRRIDSMGVSGPLGPSLGFDVVKPRVVESIFKWSDDIKKGYKRKATKRCCIVADYERCSR